MIHILILALFASIPGLMQAAHAKPETAANPHATQIAYFKELLHNRGWEMHEHGSNWITAENKWKNFIRIYKAKKPYNDNTILSLYTYLHDRYSLDLAHTTYVAYMRNNGNVPDDYHQQLKALFQAGINPNQKVITRVTKTTCTLSKNFAPLTTIIRLVPTNPLAAFRLFTLYPPFYYSDKEDSHMLSTTFLQTAIDYQDLKLVRLLLDHKVDLTLNNCNDKSPLEYAQQKLSDVLLCEEESATMLQIIDMLKKELELKQTKIKN